jgi:ribosomal protein S18 acetylase RimI-like enzyme
VFKAVSGGQKMLGEAITQEKIEVPSDNSVGFVERFSHEASLVATITMAFSTDPVARWFYPNPSDYTRWFPGFVRAFAGKAIEDRTAIYNPNYSGAALWLRPGAEPDEAALVKLVNDSLSTEQQSVMFELFEKMGEGHPTEPHWYLPMIGVDTYRQNLGIGGELMKISLARSDREGLPAYLESSNPRNISLYTRCGFEELGEIRVGDCPPLVRMLRKPQL